MAHTEYTTDTNRSVVDVILLILFLLFLTVIAVNPLSRGFRTRS